MRMKLHTQRLKVRLRQLLGEFVTTTDIRAAGISIVAAPIAMALGATLREATTTMYSPGFPSSGIYSSRRRSMPLENLLCFFRALG
jgi:hypothetical protein